MKKINLVSLVIVACLSIMLTACQAPFVSSSSTNRLARQNLLTVWSFFPNQSMDVLIENYETLHPETEVIHTGYAFSALPAAFQERASQGLGPDAVILTERELPTLIEAGLVEDLFQYHLNPGSFVTKATVSLYGSNRHLYGVPVALQTMALCYNRSQVSTPAKTLDDLLKQSQNGVGVAIESGFLKSMWGIGAFGGEFFDLANRFVLQEKNFSLWLNWLEQAKQIPTVYIDNRSEVLYNLFASGRVAYYPCWTFELEPLQQKLKNKLAIAPLPKGQMGSPSPYLETDAFLLNANTTAKQKQLAIDFARFITQQDQQLVLISGKGQSVTPVNPYTPVDQRLLPALHVFAKMVKNAVPFPISNIARLDRLRFYGDQLYNQVVQGSTASDVGVRQFLDLINNPPPNEQIAVSTSAASDEVQKVVLVDVKPKASYLFELIRILVETLKRPAVLFQLFLSGIVLIVSWVSARYLNKWLKKFIA